LKAKLLMLVVAAMLLVGSAMPAFAQRSGGPGADCTWDWDRYLWRAYEYELWYYYCDYGDDEWDIAGFWTPDWGFWWNN
jgi:hypothetical protein